MIRADQILPALTAGERERHMRRLGMPVTPAERAQAAHAEAVRHLDLARESLTSGDSWSRSRAPAWIANAEKRLAIAEQALRDLVPVARAAE